jgi:hypothetical protein
MMNRMSKESKTNAEIRQWYLEQVARIPELNEQWLQQGFSVKERAEMAHSTWGTFTGSLDDGWSSGSWIA